MSLYSVRCFKWLFVMLHDGIIASTWMHFIQELAYYHGEFLSVLNLNALDNFVNLISDVTWWNQCSNKESECFRGTKSCLYFLRDFSYDSLLSFVLLQHRISALFLVQFNDAVSSFVDLCSMSESTILIGNSN